MSSSTSRSKGRKRTRPKKDEPEDPKKNDVDITDEERKQIQEAFNLFDTDKFGTILLKEVKYAIKSMGLEIKTNELNDWLPILAKKKAKSGERKRGHRKKDSSNGANKEDDDDESIAVDFDVFSRIVAPKLQQREKSKFAFGLFDVEKKGFITVGDLKRIASELGEDSMTDEDLQEMINEADRDGDGIINQTEFFRISKKINL